MKNYLRLTVAALVSVFAFASCMKNDDYLDPYEQWELEKPIIEEYVEKTPGLEDAEFNERTGIWYKVIEKAPQEERTFPYEAQDTANNQVILADVTVDYTGKLLDGTVFDTTEGKDKFSITPIFYNVTTGYGNQNLISSWILTFMPKKIEYNDKEIDLGIIFDDGLQSGDEIRIVTPSLYAYGNYATGKIPANSPLDFTIKVLKVEKHVPEKDKEKE